MRSRAVLPTVLVAGYAFLYIPIAFLILVSFNDSRLVTSFAGFSLRWYRGLASNDALIAAAGLSLRIAAVSATGATLIGLAAGFAMARFGRFRGRTPFAVLLAAPLVMPEVITGLSLLLLFVSLTQATGWPEQRGAITVTIAHMTLGAAYVAVVVQSRLTDLDEGLEEAAADLGAPPWRVFLEITLPLVAPGLAAGWLLAFTLSLDDVVLASFTSGPGGTTLPMIVFSSMRLGLTPELFALATVIIGIVAIALVAALLVGGVKVGGFNASRVARGGGRA